LGNSQTFLPFEILIGQKPPHTEEAWIWKTLFLEAMGGGTGEPTLGLIVTWNYVVSVKNIMV